MTVLSWDDPDLLPSAFTRGTAHSRHLDDPVISVLPRRSGALFFSFSPVSLLSLPRNLLHVQQTELCLLRRILGHVGHHWSDSLMSLRNTLLRQQSHPFSSSVIVLMRKSSTDDICDLSTMFGRVENTRTPILMGLLQAS